MPPENSQADLIGIVGKAAAAKLGDAVGLAVDDALLEMRVAPAEGDLDAGMQLGDSRRIGHQQAAPDHGADPVAPDAELVDSNRVGAAGQGAVPSKKGRGTSTTRGLYRKRIEQCCPHMAFRAAMCRKKPSDLLFVISGCTRFERPFH